MTAERHIRQPMKQRSAVNNNDIKTWVLKLEKKLKELAPDFFQRLTPPPYLLSKKGDAKFNVTMEGKAIKIALIFISNKREFILYHIITLKFLEEEQYDYIANRLIDRGKDWVLEASIRSEGATK